MDGGNAWIQTAGGRGCKETINDLIIGLLFHVTQHDHMSSI